MNSHKIVSSIAALAMTFAALPVLAVTESNKTVKSVAVQATGAAYATFNQPFTTTCQFNLLYLGNPTTDVTKAMIAALLEAQSNDKHVNRIDYTVDAGGACNATIVEVGQ